MVFMDFYCIFLCAKLVVVRIDLFLCILNDSTSCSVFKLPNARKVNFNYFEIYFFFRHKLV